ncbi:hypothetical protein PVAND_007161 [Polypedilum vanderplanki]|uniref:Deformed epidermal autoregulatory factor 1 n=1 Tax=Polypedilum vanderplanki TaxID=319348 RepID=A0A9J6C701_POLVA|nr:hypothetical protein PVAND_007161 [Polypedilum vanderplanki]
MDGAENFENSSEDCKIMKSENNEISNSTLTARIVTSTDNGSHQWKIVNVPVTLPITTSMITGDQMQHIMKPMLCLDNNGFLSSNVISSGNDGNSTDLKAIVIQQPTAEQIAADVQQQLQQVEQQVNSQNHQNNTTSNSNNNNTNHSSSGSNWAEQPMSLDILPIRCKTTTAELYKTRLGSGGRGRCIKHKDNWYTPSEFENLCGRGSSKDWKRSIRYGGRSLQALIDEGILTPHATSCTCSACCDDDATASGPVRLFTPYKRRRKAQQDLQDNNTSGNGQTITATAAANTVTITTPVVTTNNACSTINNNTSIINKYENTTTQQLHIQTTPIQNNNNNTVTINANNGIKKKRFSLNIVNVKPSGAESSDDIESENITFTPAVTAHTQAVKEETVTPWQTVTEAIQEIPADYVDQTLLSEFNVPFERMRNIQKQLNQLNTDLKRCMDECKEIYLKHMERLQRERDTALLAASQIEDPNNINAQLPPGVEISNKKCANCNRDAMAECSLCRRTPYCSTFCQRKDWITHQNECIRNNEPTQQIMLIVDPE